MPGTTPLTYFDGRHIRVRDLVIATLPDGRAVVGRTMRLKVGRRHVRVAFYDPIYRRRDGQKCTIRRLCLFYRDLQPFPLAA